VRGVGLVRGSLSVHLTGEPERLTAYRRAVAERRLPLGYAADDGAALLYVGTNLSRCVASAAGARVLRAFAHRGTVELEEMPVQPLPGAEAQPGLVGASGAEDAAVAELRELRPARQQTGLRHAL
jgi:dipeptidase E